MAIKALGLEQILIMKNIKVTLELKRLGTDEEWFLVTDRKGEKRDEQERGWLIGRHEEVKDIIERLRAL